MQLVKSDVQSAPAQEMPVQEAVVAPKQLKA